MYVCMQKYRLSHFSSPEPVFMMKLRLLLLIPVIIPLLYSCRATKHVGEGEYLLDRISLSTDNRNLKNSELKSYIRQEPNHKTFGLIGLPLSSTTCQTIKITVGTAGCDASVRLLSSTTAN